MNNFLWGITFGIAISTALILAVGWYNHGPSALEKAAEYQGYVACLENAGKLRCHMTPRDFVRYYQLKVDLEIEK